MRTDEAGNSIDEYSGRQKFLRAVKVLLAALWPNFEALPDEIETCFLNESSRDSEQENALKI
jgi:hypothetical protein